MATKNPKQERSRITFKSILEASVQILSRTKDDKLNTREVAERAGVSVGSLYQYFTSADAIFQTLVKEQNAKDNELAREVFEQHPHLPAEEKLLMVFERLIHAHMKNAKVRAIFVRKAFSLAAVETITTEVETTIRNLYEQLKPEIMIAPSRDLELTLFILSRSLFAVLMSAALEPERVLGRERQMAEELTKLSLGFLR
jgi:AcrR family transcriptional regulator